MNKREKYVHSSTSRGHRKGEYEKIPPPPMSLHEQNRNIVYQNKYDIVVENYTHIL